VATEAKRTSKRSASKDRRARTRPSAALASTPQHRPKRVGSASSQANDADTVSMLTAKAEPDHPWQRGLQRLYQLHDSAKLMTQKAEESPGAYWAATAAKRAVLALVDFERALGRAQRKGRVGELLDKYANYSESPKSRFGVQVVGAVQAVERLLSMRAAPFASIASAEDQRLEQQVWLDRAHSALTDAKQLQKQHPEVVRGGPRIEAQPIERLDEIMGQPSVLRFLRRGGGGVKRAAWEVVSEVLGVSPELIKQKGEQFRASGIWPGPGNRHRATKPTTVS